MRIKRTSKGNNSLRPIHFKGDIPIEALKAKLDGIVDAVFKEMELPEGQVTLIYFSSLVDKLTLHQTVIRPLLEAALKDTAELIEGGQLSKLISAITNGSTIVYYPNEDVYFKVNTFSAPTAAITNTDTESGSLGPQNAFTESLDTNLSLIKRRIQNPNLKSRNFIVGTVTNSKVTVLYMDNIANKKNVDMVFKKIENLKHPGLNHISILQNLLDDHPFSPFPQFHETDRPDIAVSGLVDGRVVIAMNNSNGVLICPISFFELFISPEDYYNRWMTASLLRSIRFFGFFLTIILTPTYISILTFHPEMLPFDVLLNLQQSREKVPFSPLMEVLFMELVIEILREAGSRMPTKIGQTIGIVGGIVIGSAAVEASLVSNTLIVIVAVSALLSFLPPNFIMSNTSRFVRYFFILASGLFGLYGQMIAFAWLFQHLLRLTSLKTDYMAPIIPRKWTDLLDTFVRLPTKFLKYKPGIVRAQNQKTSSQKKEE
ncbi:spore germination protein [Sporosarcina oncorhynchi]|uniref:Spore germination protein n=1 Tax=Sporosarcina oncorhynchi TaxID=3056444 RepID=A0ABZ0L3I5_9BACL|nr:spore germination protein [Sporosarcina sp. T2O-4]WOV87030.1 spore germination protein [Sporosarcina sp. T2O-4]